MSPMSTLKSFCSPLIRFQTPKSFQYGVGPTGHRAGVLVAGQGEADRRPVLRSPAPCVKRPGFAECPPRVVQNR